MGIIDRRFLFAAIALFLVFGCNSPDDAGPKIDLSEAGHPRILLLEGEETQIRELIESDEIWKKVHFAILEESVLAFIFNLSAAPPAPNTFPLDCFKAFSMC